MTTPMTTVRKVSEHRNKVIRIIKERFGNFNYGHVYVIDFEGISYTVEARKTRFNTYITGNPHVSQCFHWPSYIGIYSYEWFLPKSNYFEKDYVNILNEHGIDIDNITAEDITLLKLIFS